jgi:hypothetical protein
MEDTAGVPPARAPAGLTHWQQAVVAAMWELAPISTKEAIWEKILGGLYEIRVLYSEAGAEHAARIECALERVAESSATPTGVQWRLNECYAKEQMGQLQREECELALARLQREPVLPLTEQAHRLFPKDLSLLVGCIIADLGGGTAARSDDVYTAALAATGDEELALNAHDHFCRNMGATRLLPDARGLFTLGDDALQPLRRRVAAVQQLGQGRGPEAELEGLEGLEGRLESLADRLPPAAVDAAWPGAAPADSAGRAAGARLLGSSPPSPPRHPLPSRPPAGTTLDDGAVCHWCTRAAVCLHRGQPVCGTCMATYSRVGAYTARE